MYLVINIGRRGVLASKVTVEEILVGFGHLSLGNCINVSLGCWPFRFRRRYSGEYLLL